MIWNLLRRRGERSGYGWPLEVLEMLETTPAGGLPTGLARRMAEFLYAQGVRWVAPDNSRQPPD